MRNDYSLHFWVEPSLKDDNTNYEAELRIKDFGFLLGEKKETIDEVITNAV